MVQPERSIKSSYKQFSTGDDLCFILNRLEPDGSISREMLTARIEAVNGGGFHGQVLLLKDLPFVLKTGIPGDALHDLLRRLNWGARDFPRQVSESEAQLGQIKTDLLHEAVFPISGKTIYVPRSFGYTCLPGTFAQAVERLYGRPPCYDGGRNEYAQFKQVLEKATDIYFELGSEDVGQIHKDNPFAMANIWWNNALKRWEAFDTFSAMRHTGWVFPVPFPYKFHYGIRNKLNPETKAVTFDTIHIDQFLETVEKNRGLFDPDAYSRIQSSADLYRQLMDKRNNTSDGVRNFKGLALAAQESVADFSQGVLDKAKGAVTTPVKILTDPTYVDELVLGGVRKAFDTRMITQDNLQEVVDVVRTLSQQDRGKNRFLRKLGGVSLWTGLYTYYQGSGALLKVPEVSAYTVLGLTDFGDKVMKFDLTSLVTTEDWLEKLAILSGTFIGFRIVGILNGYFATKLVGLLTGKNLNTAAKIAGIPFLGAQLAIPAQICVDAGNKSEDIWHYNVRNMIAKISKLISPAGGWGTEWEGRLWDRFGRRLEKWGK